MAPRTLSAVLLLVFGLALPLQAQQQDAIDRSFATALIRDILTAVNHGNWTGNYTVLRDYAASDFAEANDPTRLAGLFAPVREAGLDMLPIMVTPPTILQAQATAGNTQMRLMGYFPLRPRHISFDMVLVKEKARWVLLDISVGEFAPIEPQEKAPPAEPDTNPEASE
ncbi:hypothetical protein BOO69_00780 [Sulfitobacter alexandrii]|uniref:Nuclear transport factor 2 family protein n=1 Tax=Sulfitobacter alexandrii TaxID=1917485 RepID=A0A1J0WCQ7_9RHOB|nr:hypothetical protein [Sulfitobacter alexandrii]APE42105.1 hypothetical protein BOO69_00780 [Sulfitobacter alexandrii]